MTWHLRRVVGDTTESELTWPDMHEKHDLGPSLWRVQNCSMASCTCSLTLRHREFLSPLIPRPSRSDEAGDVASRTVCCKASINGCLFPIAPPTHAECQLGSFDLTRRVTEILSVHEGSQRGIAKSAGLCAHNIPYLFMISCYG